MLFLNLISFPNQKELRCRLEQVGIHINALVLIIQHCTNFYHWAQIRTIVYAAKKTSFNAKRASQSNTYALVLKKILKKTTQKMQTKLLWMQVMPTVFKSVSKSNLIILELKQGRLRCLFQHRSLAIFFFECCTHFDYSSTNMNNNSIQYLKDVLNLQKQFKSVIDGHVWKILEKKTIQTHFFGILNHDYIFYSCFKVKFYHTPI